MLMLPFDWLFPASRRVAEQFGEPLCRACRYAHHPGPQGRAPDGGRGDVALADRGQGCRTGSSTATRLAAGGPGRRNANERSHRIRADQPSPSRPTPPLCCGSRRGRRTRSRPPETSTHATLGQTRSKAARPCRWLPRTRAPSKRPIPRHAESDHARRAFGPPRSAGLILADRPCAAPSLGIDLSTSGSAAFRVYVSQISGRMSVADQSTEDTPAQLHLPSWALMDQGRAFGARRGVRMRPPAVHRRARSRLSFLRANDIASGGGLTTPG